MPIHRAVRMRPATGRIRMRAPVEALGAILAAAAFVGSISSARAQAGNWFDGLQSFPPGYSEKLNQGAASTPRPDTLNDLRPDDIPWRSDEMLAAIEKAIDRYQAHRQQGRLADHPRQPHAAPRRRRRARCDPAPAPARHG